MRVAMAHGAPKMPKIIAPKLVLCLADVSAESLTSGCGAGAMEPIGRNRLAKSFENDLFSSGVGKIRGMFDVAFLIDQYFSGARFSLQAGGEINHITDRRVVFRVV